MAGQFTNTVNYANTISSLVSATKNKLSNPYYIYNDKKPTKVTYYNMNKTKTTLDQAAGLAYQSIGIASPIVYNKVLGFYLYGMDKFATTNEMTDFGLENSGLSGSAIVLPNTVEPFPGDYFTVDMIKEELLFRVSEVHSDTLDNGNNVYQVSYDVETSNLLSDIEAQVEKTYQFIISNVGTNYKCLLEDTDYEAITTMESLMTELCDYYSGLFFKQSVQTYVYHYNDKLFYDPYLIEFLRRNKIMDYSTKPQPVFHACDIPTTFSLDYNKSFFKAVEEGSFSSYNQNIIGYGSGITDINSLFVTRLDTYYKIDYKAESSYQTGIIIFPTNIVSKIGEGTTYKCTDSNSIYNSLIAYMSGDENYLKACMMNELKKADFGDNKECYYGIPMCIYVISKYINSIMSS